MLHYPKTRADWLALRHQYVSSTESAALFGLSPYLTAFELATLKKSAEPPPSRIGERGVWGLRLEESVARGVAEDFGVKIRAINGYAVHSYVHCRMGASFDYEIVGVSEGDVADESLRDYFRKHGRGVLEIKTVDARVFADSWRSDDDIEPPAHIELQVQHQLACISRTWAAIAVLVGGNRLHVITRERDDTVHRILRERCERFWVDLDRGIMPPPVLPADAAIIAALYRYAEPGRVLDAQADDEIAALCREYAKAAADEKAAREAKESAKARLLMKIGDAEKVLAKGFTISAGVVAETEVPAYVRKAYRNFRVTVQKEKGNG